jgi:hypothetical protein
MEEATKSLKVDRLALRGSRPNKITRDPPRPRLWSAPAERSVDGALERPQTFVIATI